MIKAIIVVQSPLCLMSCIELIHEKKISSTQTVVFFSGKSDNPGKLNQAKKIIESYKFSESYISVRRRPSYLVKSNHVILRIIKKMTGWIENRANEYVKKKTLERNSSKYNPGILIGFGEYLMLAREHFPNAEVWHVDAGISSLYGAIKNNIGPCDKVFSAYDCESIGVSDKIYLRNEHKMALQRISKLRICGDIALYISSNARGSCTNEKWYIQSLSKSRELHGGRMIYYRRGNEPVSEAAKLCERYNMELAEISWPVEYYMNHELGYMPGKIFSVGSSALHFFMKIPSNKKINLFCLVPSSYSELYDGQKIISGFNNENQRIGSNGTVVKIIEC